MCHTHCQLVQKWKTLNHSFLWLCHLEQGSITRLMARDAWKHRKLLGLVSPTMIFIGKCAKCSWKCDGCQSIQDVPTEWLALIFISSTEMCFRPVCLELVEDKPKVFHHLAISRWHQQGVSTRQLQLKFVWFAKVCWDTFFKKHFCTFPSSRWTSRLPSKHRGQFMSMELPKQKWNCWAFGGRDFWKDLTKRACFFSFFVALVKADFWMCECFFRSNQAALKGSSEALSQSHLLWVCGLKKGTHGWIGAVSKCRSKFSQFMGHRKQTKPPQVAKTSLQKWTDTGGICVWNGTLPRFFECFVSQKMHHTFNHTYNTCLCRMCSMKPSELSMTNACQLTNGVIGFGFNICQLCAMDWGCGDGLGHFCWHGQWCEQCSESKMAPCKNSFAGPKKLFNGWMFNSTDTQFINTHGQEMLCWVLNIQTGPCAGHGAQQIPLERPHSNIEILPQTLSECARYANSSVLDWVPHDWWLVTHPVPHDDPVPVRLKNAKWTVSFSAPPVCLSIICKSTVVLQYLALKLSSLGQSWSPLDRLRQP